MKRETKIVRLGCNGWHRTSDGKPVNHVCVVVPPEAIQKFLTGDVEGAEEAISGRALPTGLLIQPRQGFRRRGQHP